MQSHTALLSIHVSLFFGLCFWGHRRFGQIVIVYHRGKNIAKDALEFTEWLQGIELSLQVEKFLDVCGSNCIKTHTTEVGD